MLARPSFEPYSGAFSRFLARFRGFSHAFAVSSPLGTSLFMKFPVVVGLGVDITRILRFSRLLSRPNSARFLQRILHPTENDKFNRLELSSRPQFVAGCWAAKEAVFKTLDAEDQKVFLFNLWSRRTVGQKPEIVNDAHLDKFLLSISHDDDILVATVLRQRLVET